jgi:hypothetical protein
MHQQETSGISLEKIQGKKFRDTLPKTLKQGLKKHYFKMLKDGRCCVNLLGVRGVV